MEEIWKDIPGFEGIYQASSLGNVRSLNYGKNCCHPKGYGIRNILPIFNNMGYLYVNLYKGHKTPRKRFLVHRLVAITFIENPDKKPFVDHINTIPTDNRVENLRWVTAKENSNNHRTLIHLKGGCKNNCAPEWALQHAHEAAKKPVQMIDLKNGSVIRTFKSISDACRKTDILVQSICRVLKGKGKSAGGYGWRYCERQIEKTAVYGT